MVEPAGNFVVAVIHIEELWLFLSAQVEGIAATGVESAPGRRIYVIWDPSLNTF